MTAKRIVLEVGTGTDWHGGDYTKAAVRAVQDAIHHCSLPIFRSYGIDPRTMAVDVTVGVQRPERVDPAPITAALPYGQIAVKAVTGGLDVYNEDSGETAVIANAAIVVRLDLANVK